MSIKITDYILCGDLNKLISSISKFVYKTGKIRCIVVEEKECVAGPNPDEKLIDLYQKGMIQDTQRIIISRCVMKNLKRYSMQKRNRKILIHL